MKTITVFMIAATISALFSGQPTGMTDNASGTYEDIWRRSGIERYEYILEYRTDYDYSRVRITVDPSVRFSQMTVLSGHIPPEIYTMSTVEKLLGVVQKYSGSCDVEYDAVYGYPVEIARELDDREYCRIRVIDFNTR